MVDLTALNLSVTYNPKYAYPATYPAMNELVCSTKEAILDFCKNMRFNDSYNGIALIGGSLLFMGVYFFLSAFHEYFSEKIGEDKLNNIGKSALQASGLCQVLFFVWLFWFR